ncbi:MAG: tRNA (adenosine(37)-N6)-threonylcarbamoyltransferase complex ATPase subunit type 1 TsaE [Clostridia bacterium]
MRIEVVTNSPEETKAFAKTLARAFVPPMVISLVGELGAGKTAFVQGFAEGMGICDNVTSPTFTIMNEYKGQKCPLYHFDMYRLEDVSEAYALGFEDYFDLQSLNGISVVEWAEKTKELLPKNYLEITLEKIDDDKRKIIIRKIV